MKNLLILSYSLLALNMTAQDHFSGISTSRRIGMLNAGINPAELSNLSSKFETQLFATSINVSNNKVGINDLMNSNNIEDLIFADNKPVNMRIDTEIHGPGFAIRLNKWSFGFATKAFAKLTVIDIDPRLGNALNAETIGNVTTISNNYNQRLNGSTWGEVGFSVARNIFENDNHKFNGGATLKLLFPGSYVNFGLDKFNGTIQNVLGDVYMNNTAVNLNITYSGNLANSFNNANDFSQSLFGSLNGFATDLGFNYQWKDEDSYKLNTGLSFRNIGSMTFKDNNNSSTNYLLDIQPTPVNPNGMNLNLFENADGIAEVEEILLNNGYLTKTPSNKDFKVKLPTVFSAYADVKVISKLFVTLYTQQKLGDDNQNNQVTTQNVVSITPRFSLKNFELYSPWSANEISGTTGGFGFRFYGFYLGSSSVITALTNDTKQTDFYLGYRLGLR